MPAPDRRPAVRLVMVTRANNNKVYEMAENDDGTFTARYGRIGASLQERVYPISRWDATYRAKCRKGYADVTALAAEHDDDGFDVSDPDVAALVDRLRAAADLALKAQYLVGPSQVSARQVAEAQAHLDALATLASDLTAPGVVAEFDCQLIDLYTTIPRAMSNVRAHLLGEQLAPEAVPDLLDSEQEALDRMAQRVRLADAPERPTLLDALGFDLRPVTDEIVLADIRRRMGHDAGRLERVTEVVHPKLRERFQGHVRSTWRSRTSLLWHGSRSENWLSILEGGLQLHPERAQITGKMFGYGLYFASSFQKSLGYTSARGAVWAGQRSDRGHLALCEVHLGRSLKVHRHESWCYELNGDALAKRAALVPYDSLHACAGQMLRHDEYIVYNEAQVLPRYLVEVSA